MKKFLVFELYEMVQMENFMNALAVYTIYQFANKNKQQLHIKSAKEFVFEIRPMPVI